MEATIEMLMVTMHDIVFRNRYRDLRDLSVIVENLPVLLKHRSYVVRADAYEFIAAYDLEQFAEAIREGCSDRNPIARTYAIGSYYDLIGKNAVPLLKKLLGSQITRVRLEALCLLYIEEREDGYLNEITRIVTRKNCSDYNQSLVVSEFEAHLHLQEYPEILALFRKMLLVIDEKRGLAQDMRKLLREAGPMAR